MTCAPSGVAPSGSAGASAIGPSGSQWIGAPRSDEASSSSPNAAPSAFSKPGSTVSASSSGGHSESAADFSAAATPDFLGAQLGEPRVDLLQRLVGRGMARLGGLALGGAGALHLDALGLGLGDGRHARRRIRSARPRGRRRSTPGPCGGPPRRPRAPAASAASTSGSAGRLDSSASTCCCCAVTSSRRAASRRRRSRSSAISRLTLSRSASSSAIWRVRRSCSVSAAQRLGLGGVAGRGRVGGALVLAHPLLLEPLALAVEIGDGRLGVATCGHARARDRSRSAPAGCRLPAAPGRRARPRR